VAVIYGVLAAFGLAAAVAVLSGIEATASLVAVVSGCIGLVALVWYREDHALTQRPGQKR
jgi:Flp pilus assembly protein TadB